MWVVRFFQRYAHFFAGLAGLIGYRLILPDDSPKWLEVAVLIAVSIAVYQLLFKYGVTDRRADGKPGPTILGIVAISLFYWGLAALVMILIAADDCQSGTDGIGPCIDEQKGFLIVSVWFAAIVYALGLWAAIRARRRAKSYSVFVEYPSALERENYPTLEAALDAAAFSVRRGAKEVYVEDSDGNPVPL